MEIAVYGKGGIGKSTISANITAALADKGLRVLQIGCDPKHDSTRSLMQGERIPTVLDVLREKGKDGAVIEDVLRTGYKGCGCIEAGGPQPGVGCAGRGIISAFEFLGKYSLRESYDRVIYDVLGDVVCGGFAVPVRREYADCVFLVTSGEYMALYAANNILRGIRNFDSDRYSRVAGIIYNERKLEDEDARVRRFADAVGLPVLAKVPRSEAFALAEERNMTLMQLEGALPEKKVFDYMAELISSPLKMYTANPLTDEDHERIVLGKGSPASVCVPFEAETMKCLIGGYSLAGFFALWSSFQTPLFHGIAAVSPSVWYPDWIGYAVTHKPKASFVYLSLGDKEEKTKNPIMARVGEYIRRLHELMATQGINTILEWNKGNHFQHTDERTANGFAWLINQIQ